MTAVGRMCIKPAKTFAGKETVSEITNQRNQVAGFDFAQPPFSAKNFAGLEKNFADISKTNPAKFGRWFGDRSPFRAVKVCWKLFQNIMSNSR